MYLPPSTAVNDIERIAEFVDAAAVADIVTFDGVALTSSFVPVIWERPSLPELDAGNYGRLLAHIAVANDQWRATRGDVPALAIVHGPHAYISPSWYPSKLEHGRAVPTWNYATVHFSGPISFHDDSEWLREFVTRLTDLHESRRLHRWHVDDAPRPFIDAQLRAIIGVEIEVTKLEAKAKLSQNRSTADQQGVIEGLQGEPSVQAHQVAGLMAQNLAGKSD